MEHLFFSSYIGELMKWIMGLDSMTQVMLYGTLGLTAFFVSWFDRHELWLVSVVCAGIILMYWCFSTALWMTGHMTAQCALAGDVIFTSLSLLVAMECREIWCRIMFALYLMAVILDVIHLHQAIHPKFFDALSNLGFILLFITISFSGFISILSSACSFMYRKIFHTSLPS